VRLKLYWPEDAACTWLVACTSLVDSVMSSLPS
jgi:hypothetical protein